MRIIYSDGSILECNEIYFASVDEIIADGIYRIWTIDVLRIETA